MGDHVTLSTVPAYESGSSGPGVVVVHDSWGLTPHIVDVVERLAAAGFVAVAPDLHHGEVTAADKGSVPRAAWPETDRALADVGEAIDRAVEVTGRHRVGLVGFGLGGGVALAAAARSDAVVAVAPYYGLVDDDAAVDWDRLSAVVEGEFAELDEQFPPARAESLEQRLRGLGKEATIHVHPGVGHGFFNDARPDAYAAEPALEAWERTLTVLRERLDDQD